MAWLLGHGVAASALAQANIAPDAAPGAALAHCAEIGAAPDRLACYDRLAGRAEAPTAPPAKESPTSDSGSVPSRSLLEQKGAPATTDDAAHPPESLLGKFWELEPADKRGIFNFVGYHPNYVLPLHVTNRINRAPESPTRAFVDEPTFRKEEAEFQISLRTKLLQDVVLPGADLWVAFTQQAMWQIYDAKDSTPFRNTDYEPEVIYVVPTPRAASELGLGWRWRYSQLGLAHESNGQSDPLSRSWNRVYLAEGFDRGDWSLITRLTQRINESLATDDNPDLVEFRGRGELLLGWAHGLQTASLSIRTSLKSLKSAQLQWTFPVSHDQPNGLRWFVQAFTGYGETLTDYNFRQTTLGLGVSFLQF